MKVAALIPARRNSRRLPDKNWQRVGPQTLWRHAIAHAEASGVCDPIVLSTDDDRILFGQHDLGTAITIVQPKFEQTYDVMRQVVDHADTELQRLGHDVEAICLLQPTSPLRSGADIAACVEVLEQKGIESVVSVTEGHDDIAFQVRHANRLEKVPHVVVPNGAIYCIKTAVLRAGGHWYGDFCYAYCMPCERSIDINTELDLEMARLAWQRQQPKC